MIKKVLIYCLVLCFELHNIDVTAQTLPGGVILPNTLTCASPPVETCIDQTPCKTSGGTTFCLAGAALPDANSYNIAQSCWAYQEDYTCLTKTSDCLSLKTNSACTENAGSPVCDINAAGALMTDPKYGCTSSTHTFTCIFKPASTSTIQVCDSGGSMNGLNWSTPGGNATGQFVQAAATQEFARQMALYSANDGTGDNPIFNIFKGVAKQCVKGVGALASLKNCCDGGGMAVSNSQVAAQMGINAGIAVFKSGAGYAAQAGSQWVYDTAISEGGALSFLQGFGPFTQATMGADPTFSFGMAGFGTTANSAGMFGYGSIGLGTGTEVIATSGAQAGMVVTEYPLYFNPYAFAAMVAIQLVMAWMACDQDSKELQSAKGQNLCLYVGDYVSKEINVGFAKIPIEITESYCCYNGLLAKDVARGAKPQLGLSWGSAQSPNCSGFTAEQISSLNFAALDLSDFTNQITQFAASAMPPVGVMGNTAATTVNQQCLALKVNNPNMVCN